MKKYKVGDIIVYDVYGLCRVKEIRSMSFDKNGPVKDYYVLLPVSGTSSLYYVPVGSEKTASKLRCPFTKEELNSMLSQVKKDEYKWIENRQKRSECFHSVLSKGLTSELVSLIGCIYCRKEALAQKGKRLSTTDENILSSAEKLLNEEFAFVLGIEKEKVKDYIRAYLH